jgi:hypothetical protein
MHLCLAGIYGEEGNESLARLAGAALNVNITLATTPFTSRSATTWMSGM